MNPIQRFHRKGVLSGASLACCALAVLSATGPWQAAFAQPPGDPAPPEVAAAMKARAEQFLREIARLSPMPPGTDRDRAQAWPRERLRPFRAPDETVTHYYERAETTTVLAYPYSDDPRGGARWSVRLYARELELSIHPVSGAVNSFLDGVLSNALSRDPAPDWGQCLSAEQAVARAISYLRAAGINQSDLMLRSVNLIDTCLPPCADSRVWDLTWERAWQGVPYQGQFVYVSLDAGYGRLLSFGAVIAMTPPADTRLNLSPDAAVEVATRFLAARSLTVTDMPALSLQIVLPTDYWLSTQHLATRRDPRSRLAWVVRTSIVRPDVSAPYWADVWVDTVTGEVIGGEEWTVMGRGKGAVPTRRLPAILSTARKLELRPISRKSGKASLLEVAAHRLPYFGALAQVTTPTAKPGQALPKLAPSHRLIVTRADGRQSGFDYDAKTGRIRDGKGEVLQAGSLLRALLIPK